MANWTGDPFDTDEGLDWFSLGVVLLVMVVLVAWGVIAAGGPS
jgi:hypothetical protein